MRRSSAAAATASTPGPNEMDDDQEAGVDREAVTLATWRIECLIRGGFDTYFAGRLAALEVDYRRAVALLERGCKQEQVEEILA